MTKQEHILIELAESFPQLALPISNETRLGEEYKAVVLRGERLKRKPEFSFSPFDRLETAATPAGDVKVLSLHEREDFEHCIRALAHRCEAVELPKTMGASTISGLINWEKIRNHQKEYLADGGDDWDGEFARFTSDRNNYRDTVIVLSRGFYSALPSEEAGFDAEKWTELSYGIRKYHELAHFVSRRLFPDNKDAVRDEVLADMNGIIGALGHFDAELEEKFLGIHNGKYSHGRLENYVAPEELEGTVERVCAMLDYLSENCTGEQRPFEFLLKLEEGRVFL